MRVNTNSWNRVRYTVYAPIYDSVAHYFSESRKRSIDALDIKEGDKVLIIGAGTGLDLLFLPAHCEITATDITPSMIAKLKRRAKTLTRYVEATVMDGQKLCFPDETFDYVILHLILAVIPDPTACISEASRVLKSGGRVAIFDKFLTDDKPISAARKTLNYLTNFLFSDITRSFKSINKYSNLIVVDDQEADFRGLFRLIQVIKR